MPDAAGSLWITQADSDRLCAIRLYDGADHRTYCQAISKHQQTVEKSIKAIVAAIRDASIVVLPIGYTHAVDKLISGLRHLPKPKDNRDIQLRIDKLLNDHYTSEIKALSVLAPKKPAPGALHARNTEYPYESSAEVWTAPALPDAFGVNEVERFRALADRIYEGARQIVSALRRR